MNGLLRISTIMATTIMLYVGISGAAESVRVTSDIDNEKRC